MGYYVNRFDHHRVAWVGAGGSGLGPGSPRKTYQMGTPKWTDRQTGLISLPFHKLRMQAEKSKTVILEDLLISIQHSLLSSYPQLGT